MSGYKTRSSKPFLATPFDNPERQFRAKRNMSGAPIHNIFSFYESDSTNSDAEGSNVNNDNEMTMNQYLEKTNTSSQRMFDSSPNLDGYSIPSALIQELHNTQFAGEADDDVHEHMEEVLYLCSLFSIPNVSRYSLILKVFPISLTGAAKIWFNRLPRESKLTWETLRRAFLKHYCPPSRISELLGKIHRFMQVKEETLYQAWERYNELLYRCPMHNLNKHQMVIIFYRGLDKYNRQLLDDQLHIPRMTPDLALEAIQRIANHCYKWHAETGFGPKDNFEHKVMKTFVKRKDEYGELFMKRRDKRNNEEKAQRMEEVKSMVSTTRGGIEELVSRYMEESSMRQAREDEMLKRFVEFTMTSLKEHNERIAKLETVVSECATAIMNGLKKPVATEEIVGAVNIGSTKEANASPRTFSEKVKSRIYKEKLLLDDLGALPVNVPIIESIKGDSNKVKFVQELMEKKESLEEMESVQLNARCSAVVRNELPPKEKDPGSFTLPCLIGNLEISNALADLGASISIMPYSMFLRLGVGNLKTIKMDIEMADKTMQSPKGIVENVLVKINKFVFPVDFVILEMVEDGRIPIILGRPMLATAHAKVDVFARKMTIEVNGEVITFMANNGTALPQKVCMMEQVHIEGDYGDQLDAFLDDITTSTSQERNEMSSGDDFDVFIDFEENNDALGVNLEDFQVEVEKVPRIDKPPNEAGRTMFFGIGTRIHHRNPYYLQLSCKIGYMDFHPFVDTSSPVNIISKECYNQIMTKELEYKGNNFLGIATNVHIFIGMYTFLVDFVVLDDVSEFVEDGLTGVILGSPFKAISGLGEDAKQGMVWLQYGNDKTIFRMPRAVKNFKHLNYKQLSRMRPLLELSDEDKANGYKYPHEKIKKFYTGCLMLGDEYKRDLGLIEWIQHGGGHAHEMGNSHW